MNILNGISTIKIGQTWRLKNGMSARILATDKRLAPDSENNFAVVGLMMTEDGYEVIKHWNIAGGCKEKEYDFVKIAQAWDNLQVNARCYATAEVSIASTNKQAGYYHYAGLSDEGMPLVYLEGRCSWNSKGRTMAGVCRPLNDIELEAVRRNASLFEEAG